MEHTEVTLSALTIVAPCCASTSTGAIVNPSFESQHHGPTPNGNWTSVRETWGMPDDWPWRNDGNTNAHGIRGDDEQGWISHGDWSLYVFASTAGSHFPGHYIEFYQDVDLTGMTELLFDVYLEGGAPLIPMSPSILRSCGFAIKLAHFTM